MTFGGRGEGSHPGVDRGRKTEELLVLWASATTRTHIVFKATPKWAVNDEALKLVLFPADDRDWLAVEVSEQAFARACESIGVPPKPPVP